MSVKWYALNVGCGDSFAFELEANGAEPPVRVLMDGGDETKDTRTTPAQFLESMGWDALDLMILTHIHWDHIVGLIRVAGKYSVKEAVLPYPAFELTDAVGTVVAVDEAYEHFRLYRELCRRLEAQGTRIRIRPPFGERSRWKYGCYTFRHVYPANGDPLPLYASITELLAAEPKALPPERVTSLLGRFHTLSNQDSSIWLLERDTDSGECETLVALGGDALLDSWERLLDREPLQTPVLKVSHHGKPDAVDERLLSALQPNWLLITSNPSESKDFEAFWTALSDGGARSIAVTGKNSDTRWLVSELPMLPSEQI
ncbi:MBL fold metallo-hydrolase [Paenibacillus sp. TRM 82003]|nr:MBL fold metallo-hydrolase [Paenibacillus sp. TRM 82003]